MPDPCEILESTGASTGEATAQAVDSPLTDAAATASALAVALAAAFSTSAAITDALEEDAHLPLTATAAATDSLALSVLRTESLVSGATGSDVFALQTPIAGAASSTADAAATVDHSYYAPLEAVGAGAASVSYQGLSATYLVDGTASDVLIYEWALPLTSSAAATDSLALTAATTNALTSSAAATDSVAALAPRILALSSTAAATDTLVSQTAAVMTITSTAAATSVLYEAMTGAALWMNTETTAATTFPSYPFSSIAQSGEYLLATGEAGLYVIDTGDTDAAEQIDAEVMTGLIDFDDPNKKVLDGLYVAGTAAAPIDVTVISAQGDFTYPTHLAAAADAQNNRAQLGRGFSSVYYGFKFNNRAGNDFAVDVARVQVGALKRKR